MKKLMIAAAIVCAAALSHGAAFTWSADYVVTDTTYYTGVSGLAAVFMTSDIAAATLSEQLAKGDFSNWTTYGQDAKVASDEYGNYTANTSFPATGTAGSHDFYVVFLDKATTGAATEFLMTDTVTKTLVDGSGNETQVGFGDLSAVASVPGNWTSINSDPPTPTPEPTSAMLMLLGVAGLALRRKQK